MPAPKRPNTAAATEAAARAARRRRLDAMAAELRAAGYDLRPPPECPHDRTFLIWADDQYICPACGDEWDFDTMEAGRDWQ